MGWRAWIDRNHRVCMIRRDWWAPSWMAAIGIRSRVFGIAGPNGSLVSCQRTTIYWAVPEWLKRVLFKARIWRPEGS